ncbi:DUF6090 family protein [Muriicola soli]|uniref:Uncharacterized protein n=1 Tax=Muriicola soli TaxID=2507538 RepID=A0A411E8U9_9FLAO|nr:DUF6090 family protein [Muriicola soli]QBA63963.1 hypothetical protein EQY75_05075 [Muriicola soli]
MIKFFRKIRLNLVSEGKTGKYLKYAFGEILLVVIGILIALSINNWNENRKSQKVANEIYLNLRNSLVQDSTEVQRIIKSQSKSLNVQKELILKQASQESIEFEEINLHQLIEDIQIGVFSFFPKTGIYNSIVSNNGMDLLKSTKIKASLINLYDYQYERYANMDATIENKYHSRLFPVIFKKIGYVGNVTENPDQLLFKENYEELVSECRNVHGILTSNRDLLIEISKEINELLQMIRDELDK